MKKIYILALAALALAFSCQKNENAPETATEPEVRTFTLKFAQPDTKVAINDSDAKTTWEVGDEILVHGEGSSNREIVTLAAGDISADGRTATITISSVTPYDRSADKYISTYYASYPASACPTGNFYWNSRFSETNHFLMFGCNDGDTFTFYNLCGIISFKVYGDFDSYVFTGNGGETVGYSALQSRVRVKDDHSVSIEYVRTGTADSYTTVPLTSISGPVVGDGSTINYICLPNGANFTGGFTIKFLKSGSIVKTLTTTKSVTVLRNEYRPMGVVTTYLEDYVAPSTHDSSIPMGGATALDASANANCYIVDGSDDANEGKVFTFKAYKGKSSTGVGTVASAEILWETWNNNEAVTANSVIAAVDYDKQSANDYYTIVFKMPATLHPGNAVIAAKDDADNILWSWHIWVPKGMHTDITDATIFGSKAIMSRNLGALVDAPAGAAATVGSYGLFYEWGRKDPFPGMGAVATDGVATVAGTAMTKYNGTMTIAETIQNPTKYAWKGGDWCDSADQSMTLWTTSKTIYDPCPPGYIVPHRNTSVHFWGSTALSSLDASDNFVDNGGSYYSFQLGTSTPVVFPYAGYIDNDYGNYYKAGKRSAVWSSYCSTLGKAYARDSRHDGPSFNRSELKTSRGASVRCVAEAAAE